VRFLHKGSAFILRLGRDRAVMQACPRLTRFNRPNNLQMGASAFKWGDPASFGCICPPLFAEKLYRPFFGFISPSSEADAAPQIGPLTLLEFTADAGCHRLLGSCTQCTPGIQQRRSISWTESGRCYDRMSCRAPILGDG